MKIIKRGQVPGNEVYRLDCNHCHTEFEIEAKEAKYNSDQRDGDYLSIECPICKTVCTVQARLR
jgi:RNase P subunit RPR2